MKVGIDLIEIDRFKMLDYRKFLGKYYTIGEIEYILTKKKKFETLAGIYALKEAVLKAFKIGIGAGVSLKEVEIGHFENIPFVVENEKIKELLKKEDLSKLDVSISHSDSHATAICIIY